MKDTVRNPKFKPAQVIEVVTQPEKKHSDPVRSERNITAPHQMVLTNPEKQTLGDVESLRKAVAQKDYQLSMLRVSNTHNEDKLRRIEGQLENRDKIIDQLKAR